MSSKMRIHPLILCGGQGRRLWPLSRRHYPKQFLPLHENSTSLLAKTIERVSHPCYATATLMSHIETSSLLTHFISSHHAKDCHLIFEPCSRNTAGAIATGSLHIKNTTDEEDPVILVLPSDHRIDDEHAFHKAVATAYSTAKRGFIVAFGVTPSKPHTGYGYIEHGTTMIDEETNRPSPMRAIARFHEKPSLQQAEAYLKTKNYSWNAGIFLFTLSTLIKTLREHAPDILRYGQESIQQATRTTAGSVTLGPSFHHMPQHPFDTAIMEKIGNGAVLPCALAWSDIGSWQSVWEHNKTDDDMLCRGHILSLESERSLLWGDDSTVIAALHVRDMIVVAHKGAILVAPMHKSEQVTELVKTLEQQKDTPHLDTTPTYRPWGYYHVLASGKNYLTKRIVVHPQGILSLQYHQHRCEHWVVAEGTATITKGDDTFSLKENQSLYIERLERHRLANKTQHPLTIIEVQTGAILREDDIVRLEDVYGRAGV